MASGTVTLSGAYNSLLVARVSLQDRNGMPISSADLKGGSEIAPSVDVTSKPDSLRFANVFLAIYDRNHRMVDLQQWELDLNNPLAFIQTRTIPANVEVGSVKIMILDESMTPLMAPQFL